MNTLVVGAFSLGIGASLGSWLDTHPLIGLGLATAAAIAWLKTRTPDA